MRTRLLILSPTASRGGAEEYLLTVARDAAARGWDVTSAFELSPETQSLADELSAGSWARYVASPIRAGRRYGVIVQALATARLLLQVRPDVVLIVLPWPTYAMGCMIATALAAIPTAVVYQLAPWPVRAGRWRGWCRWAQHRHQCWISVSDQNAQAVVDTFGVPRDSVRTIYNGGPEAVELSEEERSSARRALRGELQLPVDAKIVVTVGRLDSQKGYRDLLESLPRLPEGGKHIYFVWVGDGDLRPELEALIERRGLRANVRLMGHRNDVDQILDGADLFLLPSRFEGLPFALMEALARGIPSVSSDAGGSPEIMRHGDEGLIHRRKDPADLAQKLGWAIEHPDQMRAMAASGRSRARVFSEARMLQQTMAVLDTLRGLHDVARDHNANSDSPGRAPGETEDTSPASARREHS